jgi:REP-associated tyrosine transposase
LIATGAMYNADKHHRRSLRLKDYDYKQKGAYFVTVCTQNRACLFGTVSDENVQLNDAGRMIQRTWAELPARFSDVDVDVFMAIRP